MSKALVVIKSLGIGDLVILIANIHAISKSINKPITVLAQKSTHASEILKNDPYVEEIIELDKKGFFNIIKKIQSKKFTTSYIYSDSLRLYLIARLSGIKKNFHYTFFSKKGKNFFNTAKTFTEKVINNKINHQPKIYFDTGEKNKAIKKFNISSKINNIVCGISASGPTKKWDVQNYIKLFENINNKFPCRFFLAGGDGDKNLISKILNSSVGQGCVSFADMPIAEVVPIISACKICISNDTGFAHISAALGLKTLMLFMDSPPLAYGAYSNNIYIIVPDDETIESCGHNTRGKDKISFDKVLNKTLELLN
jgi:heptosyltransferase-2